MDDIIDIYYFSGTGNTLLAVNTLAATLEKHGKKVNLYKTEHSIPEQIDITHTIGLAFPVAAFSTFPFIWKFIDAMPNGKGCKVFMLDTLAGFSGGIVGPLKKALLKKSYWPIGAKEFIMPGNFCFIKSAEKNNKKIRKTLPKVAKYAENLLTYKTTWRRIPLISDLIYLIAKSPKPWQKMGANIIINNELCTKCGLCAKLCPVKNLSLENNNMIKHDKCESCMRCVTFCPANAVSYKNAAKKYQSPVKYTDLL